MKKKIVYIIKIIALAVIVVYMIRSGIFTVDIIRKLISTSSLKYIFVSAVLYLLSQFICAYRIKLLARSVNAEICIASFFNITMVGNFFNMVIPGAVGGDIVKMLTMHRYGVSDSGKIFALFLTDRVIGLYSLIISAFLGAIYLFLIHRQAKYEHELLVLLITLAIILCGTVLFIALINMQNIRNIIKEMIKKKINNSQILFFIEFIKSVVNDKASALLLLLSIFSQYLSVIAILILTGIINSSIDGFNVSFLSITSITLLFGIIPVTPGNLGWTELVAAYAWSLVGSSNGSAIFLYWRVVTVFSSLPWGVIYLMSPQYKSHNKVMHAND
jgi:glycosyltransferase 2 family protein